MGSENRISANEYRSKLQKKKFSSKYNNKKTDGYDSAKESKRASQLKWMESIGIIKDLKEQVKFELIPNQVRDGKVVERSCNYIADFTYLLDGKLIVEDSKGMRTPDYRIKRKLMLSVHKIRIVET
ncbi:MAG: DUF1064 domain-containing protein [Paludibacteraceae bacterium]|nr:DUF1064 domain-containing protein [Paludibacteraceae bacterium]